MTPTLVVFLVTVTLNVASQILLKVGSARPGISTVFPLSTVNVYTLGGGACLVVALGFYILILQRLPLILAQSIFTVQFAATVLAAALVLGERVAPIQWGGIAFIAAGLFLLSR